MKIEADIINQFQNKRYTRFLCTLEGHLAFQCGLNHLGDGNFFIILSSSNLSSVQKKLGDIIHFELNAVVDDNIGKVEQILLLLCLLLLLLLRHDIRVVSLPMYMANRFINFFSEGEA